MPAAPPASRIDPFDDRRYANAKAFVHFLRHLAHNLLVGISTLCRRRLPSYVSRIRRGYQEASLAEVAREAGLTTGAVYSNFRDREDLFLAALTSLQHALWRAAAGTRARTRCPRWSRTS